MTTTSQIKHLIEKFEIKEKIEKSFLKILEIHTCDDLDIENKNISINIKNIEHFKTELGYNKFQTPLLNNLKNEIGYFALVITDENETIDEYFVIN